MILDKIVAEKRRGHERRQPVSEMDLYVALVQKPTRDLRRALKGDKLRVIAEFKRTSPSAGVIRADADPRDIAKGYEQAGAAGLSVLTDREFFGAREDDLQSARAVTRLPVLRKDFLLDRRDVLETRLMGADAALLIVRLLDQTQLAALISIARAVGLMPLVEAHTDAEVERALAAGADVIGVNHRDLDTLAIDLSLSSRARKLVGPNVILVAESGIKTRGDVARMREHGADAILVGESLLKAPDPGAALAALIG